MKVSEFLKVGNNYCDVIVKICDSHFMDKTRNVLFYGKDPSEIYSSEIGEREILEYWIYLLDGCEKADICLDLYVQ